MILTQKAQSFVNKILKHYPVVKKQPQTSCCESEKPPGKDIQPFAHMHDHRKERDIYERPTVEKLQNMRYFKQMGNKKFKEKKLEEAAYFYQKVIIYGDYTFPDKKEDTAEMELLLQQANMNLAICLIKEENWGKVEMFLREATKFSEESGVFEKYKKMAVNTKKKAYYWHCKFHIRKNNFDSAAETIQKLQQLEKSEQISTKEEAAQLLRQLEHQKANYKQQTKQLSKKMFS